MRPPLPPRQRSRRSTARSWRGRALGLPLVVIAAIGCLPTDGRSPASPEPGRNLDGRSPASPEPGRNLIEALDPAVASFAAIPALPALDQVPAVPTASTPPLPEDPAVVVVVLDGARWQDVFSGADPALASASHVAAPSADELMPHLHALLHERGAALGAPDHGDPITASGPNFVSLPGYTEIFTGHRRHSCADNDCPATRSPTLFDEVRSRVEKSQDVAVFASWDRIERAAAAGKGSLVLSTGRSRVSNEGALRDDPSTSAWLDEGRSAAPFPGKGDFRPDRFTAILALRYLEAKRPRLMFLGLGEPDEFAHHADYAGYLAALQAADRTLGELFDVLDRMGPRGRQTTVFVTADHGRARDYRFHGRNFPESSRVWLVAAGAGVSARGFVRSERPHRLADLAPTVRLLLGLPQDDAPSGGSPLHELFVEPPSLVATAAP
jgi:hypothetical protein